ncbi:MAG: histidinol-phosphate transaminase [Pseudomonadota bacterium]
MAAYALTDLDSDAFSLAQNESFWPPSPAALAALADGHTAHALYPDPDWTALRAAIAGVHGLPPDHLLCGSGSMELLGAVIRAFSGPGDTVLASDYSYAYVATACRHAGSERLSVPEPDYRVDVDALLDAVRDTTRIVFVANPGNPTGTHVPPRELIRLRSALPDHVLLVVDEAYGEFAPADGGVLWPLIERGDTVVTRSFSKAYALAGARVGWCALHASLAAEVRKLLNPNNVSRASQRAAAAAIQDANHLETVVAATRAARTQLCDGVRALGLAAPESHTNFVLVPFADAQTCTRADTTLRSCGVQARSLGGYGLSHCLRITVADPPTISTVLSAIEDSLS